MRWKVNLIALLFLGQAAMAELNSLHIGGGTVSNCSYIPDTLVLVSVAPSLSCGENSRPLQNIAGYAKCRMVLDGSGKSGTAKVPVLCKANPNGTPLPPLDCMATKPVEGISVIPLDANRVQTAAEAEAEVAEISRKAREDNVRATQPRSFEAPPNSIVSQQNKVHSR